MTKKTAVLRLVDIQIMCRLLEDADNRTLAKEFGLPTQQVRNSICRFGNIYGNSVVFRQKPVVLDPQCHRKFYLSEDGINIVNNLAKELEIYESNKANNEAILHGTTREIPRSDRESL